jgi:hypothetical protein
VAYFLIIFAVWDIFYYVWLKVLLDWPASLMEWDVLFLMPMVWASAVLYPVLVSLLMFVFGVAILQRNTENRPLVVKSSDWVGWLSAAVIVVVSFCLGGRHIAAPNYQDYFHWPVFAVGFALGGGICARTLRRKV